MDFVPNLGDATNILEIAVGGIGRAEIIDNCIVRVTFFKPAAANDTTRTPVCQLVWTIPAWISARASLQELAVQVARIGVTDTGSRTSDVSLSHH